MCMATHAGKADKDTLLFCGMRESSKNGNVPDATLSTTTHSIQHELQNQTHILDQALGMEVQIEIEQMHT